MFHQKPFLPQFQLSVVPIKESAKMILHCLRMLVRILYYQSLAISALLFHRGIGFILTKPYGVEKSQIYESESEMED